MCKKNNFQIFLLIAIEMAILNVFSQKEGLGPLGVKVDYISLLAAHICTTFQIIMYRNIK